MNIDKNTAILIAVAIVTVIVLIYLWHHSKSGMAEFAGIKSSDDVSNILIKQTKAELSKVGLNSGALKGILRNRSIKHMNIMVDISVITKRLPPEGITEVLKQEEFNRFFNSMLSKIKEPLDYITHIYMMNNDIVNAFIMHQNIQNDPLYNMNYSTTLQEWETNSPNYADKSSADKYKFRIAVRDNWSAFSFGFTNYTTYKPNAPNSTTSILFGLYRVIKIKGFVMITKQNAPNRVHFVSTYDLIDLSERKNVNNTIDMANRNVEFVKVVDINSKVALPPLEFNKTIKNITLPLNPKRTNFGTKWYNIKENSIHVELFNKSIETDKLSIQLESRNNQNMYIHSFVLII